MPTGEHPVYRDPSASTDERVSDLLRRMTVEEKVGQLIGTSLGGYEGKAEMNRAIGEYGIGSVGPIEGGIAPYDTPRAVAELMNEIQEHAIENTRFGVPLLAYAGMEHGHGFVKGSTLFPQRLGLAASRDPDLVEKSADVTGTEARATGLHQSLNPTCDVVRDPRWGRTFQTFGSSPHLCGEMSVALVRGYEGDGIDDPENVISTPKHFPAYGDPVRGADLAPVDVSEYTLRRVFLPPFRAALDAGAESLMPCYNEVNGYPVHGSGEYLTDLLREELGFDGFVVSDWGGVDQLHRDHRTARSSKEATYQAVTAGVDVISIGGAEHARNLRELVEEGEIGEERIDEAAGRVLDRKFRLGLFEDPYVDPEEAVEALGTEASREIAADCARRSLTLLKNDDDVLPLSPDLDQVLVTGPNADALDHQLGGWTQVEEPLPPGVTVREGIERAVGDGTTVTYHQGSTVNEEGDHDQVREAAVDADAAVVVLGETHYVHEFIRSPVEPDEFPRRTEFELPEAQRSLLRTVHETGTPTVLVLITGRPLPIPWAVEHVPGILLAYYPGTEGGTAVADVLFGEVNPSGKLPISIPRSAAHLPVRFNHRPHPGPAGDAENAADPPYDPLFGFGHGLSYTTFEYDGLSTSADVVGPEETFSVDVTVSNTGNRYGEDAIDLFVDDQYSSRVTPVREHVGFARVGLDPGERETVAFEVRAADLGVLQSDGETRTEAGTFEFFVEDLSAELEVDGQYR